MAENGLTRFAAAIADRTAIDWETESTDPGTTEQDRLAFQALEEIVRAHEDFQAPAQQIPTQPMAAAPEPGPTQSSSELPFERWGSLELKERLGEGSFGTVYRAFDFVLQNEVALKLRKARSDADDDADTRFLEEARRLAKVRHQNVLSVYGAEVIDDQLGFWTEFINGETLESLLERKGRHSAREAALIGIELCGALAAVHGAGLVHRDVKTTNVMREEGGRIVLLDFGTVTQDASRDPDLEATSMAGTPLYMAPEMLAGGPPTPTADVYSLGILLYRMVSGQYAHDVDVLQALRPGAPIPPTRPLRDLVPNLPAEFVRVVEKATASTPEDRYASAGEVEAALAGSLGLGEDDEPWHKKTPARLIGALAVVGLVALAVFFPRGEGTDESADSDLIDDGPDPSELLDDLAGRAGTPKAGPLRVTLAGDVAAVPWGDELEGLLGEVSGLELVSGETDRESDLTLSFEPSSANPDLVRVRILGADGAAFGGGRYDPKDLEMNVADSRDVRTLGYNLRRLAQNEAAIRFASSAGSVPQVGIQLYQLTPRSGEEERHQLTCLSEFPSKGICSECFARRPVPDSGETLLELDRDETISFVVHNRSPETWYAYVVDVMTSGQLFTLRPATGHPDAFVVPPHDSLALETASRKLTDAGMLDTYLCILMDSPVVDWPLDLKGFIASDDATDNLRGENDATNLAEFLESFGGDDSRGSAPGRGASRHGGRVFEIRVR